MCGGGGDLSVVLKPASTLSHITEVDPGFKGAFKKGVCGRCASNKHRARISALQLEHPVFLKKPAASAHGCSAKTRRADALAFQVISPLFP